jgi:hypothetical protein
LKRYLDDRRAGREIAHFRDIDYQDGKLVVRDR